MTHNLTDPESPADAVTSAARQRLLLGGIRDAVAAVKVDPLATVTEGYILGHCAAIGLALDVIDNAIARAKGRS